MVETYSCSCFSLKFLSLWVKGYFSGSHMDEVAQMGGFLVKRGILQSRALSWVLGPTQYIVLPLIMLPLINKSHLFSGIKSHTKLK